MSMFRGSQSHRSIMKHRVVVQTTKVDEAFGGFLVEYDAAGVVLQARLDDPISYYSSDGTVSELEASTVWVPLSNVSFISRN